MVAPSWHWRQRQPCPRGKPPALPLPVYECAGWGGGGRGRTERTVIGAWAAWPAPCTQTFLKSILGFSGNFIFVFFPLVSLVTSKKQITHSCVTWLPATFFQQTPRAGNSARLGLQKSRRTHLTPSPSISLGTKEPAGQMSSSRSPGRKGYGYSFYRLEYSPQTGAGWGGVR